MEKFKIKVNRRNLTGLVRKTKFDNGGMFISYQFIAIEFELLKNSTAKFYESTQVSQNSWTNYPGIKIWNNANLSKWNKKDVIESCENYIVERLEHDLNAMYFEDDNIEITIQLIGF